MFLILYLIQLVPFQQQMVEEHAIYLSTISISISDQRLDVIIKVFEDDLRDAIHNHQGFAVDTSSAEFTTYVDDYIRTHLKIKSLDDEWNAQVKEVKRVGDSFQINFNPADMALGKRIKIKADYLMELFPTQQNIMVIKKDSRQFYHIFKNGKSSTEIDLTR